MSAILVMVVVVVVVMVMVVVIKIVVFTILLWYLQSIHCDSGSYGDGGCDKDHGSR